jgi:hypothetical protein
METFLFYLFSAYFSASLCIAVEVDVNTFGLTACCTAFLVHCFIVLLIQFVTA